jgi:hypothetical protein
MTTITLDKRLNNHIIIDTETTKLGYVYNYAYIVFNNKGIIKTYNTLITEAFQYDNSIISKLDKRLQDYDNMPRVSIIEAVTRLLEDVKDYNADVYAFSASHFDTYHIKQTLAIANASTTMLQPFKDLQGLSSTTICNQPTYIRVCRDKNMKTKKGYISRTAQNLYRYVSKDYDYKQTHTALDDCFIELAIWKHVKAQHKAINYKVSNYKRYAHYCNSIED